MNTCMPSLNAKWASRSLSASNLTKDWPPMRRGGEPPVGGSGCESGGGGGDVFRELCDLFVTLPEPM